jgi:putative membrane protein
MRTIFNGIAIGIANIIPGVSGGTLAVILGVYDRLIEAISEFLSNKEKRKSNLLFLFKIGIGVSVGIFAFAKLISFCLETFPKPTAFFFMGLIIGGIPVIYKSHTNMKPSIKKIVFFIIALFIILILSLFTASKGVPISPGEVTAGLAIFMFVSGFIAAGTMVVPGISGSFMLLLLGSYSTIIGAVSSLEDNIFALKGLLVNKEGLAAWLGSNQPLLSSLKTDFLILGMVFLGAVVGIIVFTRVIHICLKTKPVYTYYVILGLIVGSLFKIFPGISFDVTGLISLVSLATGILISRNLG